MFALDQYQLLDFGEGRKLERFGSYVIDRPAAIAEGAPKSEPLSWRAADARYLRQRNGTGRWLPDAALPAQWTIEHPACTLELRPTPFGHLGVFAEQAANWDWIVTRVSETRGPLKVVNLFAYTGGSTLAAASAGARVVHIDAAKSVVGWARRNSQVSSLDAAPVRWITEDVRRFAQREVSRGNRYDAIILDPPSYGHGPRGEAWKIEAHLPPLLRTCRGLTDDRLAFVVLTCHTPHLDARRLRELLGAELFGTDPPDLTVKSLNIAAADGRQLPCGIVARWPDRPA